MKKLTDKQKANIFNKHEWEGNLLDYGASSFFKGSEYEKRIEKLIAEYDWFNKLIESFEEFAENDEDEEF